MRLTKLSGYYFLFLDVTMKSEIYYSDYLQLDKILDAQQRESEKVGKPAHDEMLFIITHQSYELWFKQIIFELQSIVNIFKTPTLEERRMGRVIHRLARIKSIQRVLVEQIDVIETMTPMDFMEFRDLLVPASGFQSIQFKQIEILLGLKRDDRIKADREFFESRLCPMDLGSLNELETETTLLELTDEWLQRMPFLDFEEFEFWEAYQSAVDRMLASDRAIIEGNSTLTPREIEFQITDLENTRKLFFSVTNEDEYNKQRDAGEFRLTQSGFLSALFIHLYRDEPMLYSPFRYLTLLTDIDELFTIWRQRHATMVRRMLGTKIGTGGSSGHDYLSATTRQNRVFTDLTRLSTFLIPREDLPELPKKLSDDLGFFFGRKHGHG